MSNNIGTVIADFKTTLSSKISVGETSFRLTSNIDSDGESLPNGVYTFTVSPNNSKKEYFIGNLLGLTVSNIKSISRQGVQTTGALKEHRFNETVLITNFPTLFLVKDVLDGETLLDSEHPIFYDGEATLSNEKNLVTKKYVDETSFAPLTQISKPTEPGKFRVSVTPVNPNNPIVLLEADPRLPTTAIKAALAGTGTPSVSNRFVTTDHELLQNNVLLTYDQYVDGIKTFTSIPISSSGVPTTENQVATKGYVDSK